MPDGDRRLRHAERAVVGDAVPVELHVGHPTDRPKSLRRAACLDAGRETGVRRLRDVPLVVQRETECHAAFGHDDADRRVQTGTDEEIDERVLQRSELSLEHAGEAVLFVVLLYATEVEGQIAILRQQVAYGRNAA